MMLSHRGQSHCPQGAKGREQVLEVSLLKGLGWELDSGLGKDLCNLDSNWAEIFLFSKNVQYLKSYKILLLL